MRSPTDASSNNKATLEKELSPELLRNAISLFSHEMRVPVVAFRAIIERMKYECSINGCAFKHDYFKEIDIYLDVMRRLLGMFDELREGSASRGSLDRRRVLLFADIIVPATRHLQPLLSRRGFSAENFEYRGVREVPAIYVDPVLMTQVFFALIENAVKYFQGLASTFRVTIEASRSDSHLEIIVADYGIGIPRSEEGQLFQPGFRTKQAAHSTTGNGLGLWMARSILQRHGGELFLKSRRNPTSFAIRLPAHLSLQSAKAPSEPL